MRPTRVTLSRTVARPSLLGLLLLVFPAPLPAAELSLELEAGYAHLTNARRSASALFGSAGGLTYGGGVRLALGERLFLRAGAGYLEKTGERVFVADSRSDVFPLGHPLTLRLLSFHVTLGYRLPKRKFLTPYVAFGAGLVGSEERSTVGGLDEVESTTKASGRAAAGVEIGEGRFRFATEIAYSVVPNAIGVGGVSQVYGETDMGGLSVVGKVIISRAR
jgi:hypothetical protein